MYDRHSFLTKPLLEQMLFATSSVTNTGRCQNSQTSTLSKAKAVRLIGEGIFFLFSPLWPAFKDLVLSLLHIHILSLSIKYECSFETLLCPQEDPILF